MDILRTLRQPRIQCFDVYVLLKNCFLVRKHWISGSKLCLKQSFEPIIDALPIIQSDSGRFPYVSINALYGILR